MDVVPAHPPDWCTAAVHCGGEWAGVRHLEAVATHPALLADGYDPGSGLAVAGPARPAAADVAAAVADLLDVVAEFPFQAEAHRAAWLASLSTPMAWFAADGPAPLFHIDKNVRGAGAGRLVDSTAFTPAGPGRSGARPGRSRSGPSSPASRPSRPAGTCLGPACRRVL